MHVSADLDIELEQVSELGIDFIKSLVLWNDDHNTFEYVIACLVRYVGKREDEASKIAHIVHTKGRCIILEGSKEDLVEYYNILRLKNLTVSIE